jgi:hypothetical protein
MADSRRKENERMKKMGGTHGGKMVISPVGLTPLARNMDGMACASTNFEGMAYKCLQTFSWHMCNRQLF